MVMSLLQFVLGRLTNFTVGAVVALSGVRHILNPADSLLGAFLGLPEIVAFIIGFPVTFIGLMYLMAAFVPGKLMA